MQLESRKRSSHTAGNFINVPIAFAARQPCPPSHLSYFRPLYAIAQKRENLAGNMSLLQLGPVLFGGTGGIISYLRGHGLLAVTKDYTRYGSIIKHKLKIKDIQYTCIAR